MKLTDLKLRTEGTDSTLWIDLDDFVIFCKSITSDNQNGSFKRSKIKRYIESRNKCHVKFIDGIECVCTFSVLRFVFNYSEKFGDFYLIANSIYKDFFQQNEDNYETSTVTDTEETVSGGDADDLRSTLKAKEMKQSDVEDPGMDLNSECEYSATVTDHSPPVGIESVKIERVDPEFNTSLMENTTRNSCKDIPFSTGKENNLSKVVNKSDSKMSDNIKFASKIRNEEMADCVGFKNSPLKPLESNYENTVAKTDPALCNDILKSNGEQNNRIKSDDNRIKSEDIHIDGDTLISLRSESESSASSDSPHLFGLELVKKEVAECLGTPNSLKGENCNTDPLHIKNGKNVCGNEKPKARSAETNDSKTDVKSVDISQNIVNGTINNSQDNSVIQSDSSSLTKYPGEIQTESSSSKVSSNRDHTEVNKPLASITNDPIRTFISTNDNLRKLLDDANRDSGSRQTKRKGDLTERPLEKRNCSSLDRLTRMCEQDDPTVNKDYITNEMVIRDTVPECLQIEEVNNNKTKPRNVPETQHNPRIVMDNGPPPPEYPYWLDQSRVIPHINGNMHNGFSFRRDHFRYNEGHGHFRYNIPDHVRPPPFHISNGYNQSLPHSQYVQFQHGYSTDRPVTDQDYLGKVIHHEEMYHASKMSLIESDKACGEAEHVAKIKLITAELEVVELQRMYWKKRLEQIPKKDNDTNEEL